MPPQLLVDVLGVPHGAHVDEVVKAPLLPLLVWRLAEGAARVEQREVVPMHGGEARVRRRRLLTNHTKGERISLELEPIAREEGRPSCADAKRAAG